MHKADFKSYLSTIFTVIIAFPIFVQTFGPILFTTDYVSPSGAAASNSKMVYIMASILGQGFYTFATGFSSGFLIFPTFENRSSAATIFAQSNSFLETLLCTAIGAIAASAIAFFLSISKLGRFLKYLPSTVIIFSMLTTGMDILLMGTMMSISKKAPSRYVIPVISVVLTIGLALLVKTYNNPRLILGYAVAVIAITNMARLAIPSNLFYDYGVFSNSTDTAPSFENLFASINWASVDVYSPLRHWKSILSLALFPLVPFSVNIAAYSNALGLNFSMSKELFALGASNLLSSLGGYPVCFNCSGSILFHLAGSNTRRCSALAVVAMIAVYYLIGIITKIIPSVANSMIMQFVGLSFLMAYVPVVFMASLADMIAMAAMVVVHYYFKVESLGDMAMCLLVCAMMHLIRTGSFRTYSKIETTMRQGRTVISVKGSFNFYNAENVVSFLEESILPDKRPVKILLNLSPCTYVDMTANIALYEVFKKAKSAGRPFRIIGQAPNLYSHLYSATELLTKSSLGDFEQKNTTK